MALGEVTGKQPAAAPDLTRNNVLVVRASEKGFLNRTQLGTSGIEDWTGRICCQTPKSDLWQLLGSVLFFKK